MRDYLRFVISGWIAGAAFGFGLASFGWWNPYLSLSVLLSSFVFVLTIVVAERERRDDQ